MSAVIEESAPPEVKTDDPVRATTASPSAENHPTPVREYNGHHCTGTTLRGEIYAVELTEAVGVLVDLEPRLRQLFVSLRSMGRSVGLTEYTMLCICNISS